MGKTSKEKIMKYISLALFLFSVQSFASFKKPEIHIYDWNGIDVVYLEDNKLPLYDVIFYFADGSLSDTHIKGETEAMFDNLDLGTRRFSRNDIQDNLEFFGVSYSSFVTHEYTTFSFSGLVKDIVPTTKKICHLFSDATFRASELKKEKKKYINSLQNLVSSPSGLASRAFRELSLKETPFYYPTEGKLRDIKKINTRGLKRKLSYFNKKVKKRIYLSGPKSILDVKSIILKECGWDIETSTVVRREPLKEKKISNNGPEIHLVTVPQSNQAQVLIGRHLLPEEYTNQELMTLSSGFLGGGFTSKLMRAVRVKRGLTYGISSFAAGQKEYGRLGISSSTKNETVIEMLDVIKDEIEKIGEGKFEKSELERARGLLVGSYPFRFESKSAFLGQLLYLDHIERSYEDFFNFQDNLKKISREEVSKNVLDMFGWNKQVIVILGSASLKKPLSKLGKVKIHSYKRFL